MSDFVIIKQMYYTLFRADSGSAKLWAIDNWQDNMKRVTSDVEADLTKELERAGFTVGSKAE